VQGVPPNIRLFDQTSCTEVWWGQLLGGLGSHNVKFICVDVSGESKNKSDSTS
jgi:hypothetical protein